MRFFVAIIFGFSIISSIHASDLKPEEMLGLWEVSVQNPALAGGAFNLPYCALDKGEQIRLVDFHDTEFDYPSLARRAIGPNSYVLEKFWADRRNGSWYRAFDRADFFEINVEQEETFVEIEGSLLGIRHMTTLSADKKTLEHTVVTTEYKENQGSVNPPIAVDSSTAVQTLSLDASGENLVYRYTIDSEEYSFCEFVRAQ